jgi:hypothetical protein
MQVEKGGALSTVEETPKVHDYWEMVKGKKFQHSGKTRKYFIRSEEIDWDYVPQGKNLISGEAFTSEETLFYDVREQGSVFKKCLYQGFTDETFSKKLPHPEYLGQLGPVLHAEVCLCGKLCDRYLTVIAVVARTSNAAPMC